MGSACCKLYKSRVATLSILKFLGDHSLKYIEKIYLFWYNNNMYNWSVDEKKFKKENPKGYKIWKLQQMINYGWEKIKDGIDPSYRKYLEFLLWPQKKKVF